MNTEIMLCVGSKISLWKSSGRGRFIVYIFMSLIYTFCVDLFNENEFDFSNNKRKPMKQFLEFYGMSLYRKIIPPDSLNNM